MSIEERAAPHLLAKRIVNALGKPFGINPFPRAFANTTVEPASERAEVFDTIYRANFWGSDESRSGVGSERDFSMAYLKSLRTLLQERGLRCIFDAPCGDLNWMAGLATDPQIAYAGGDISQALIADLRQRFPEIDLRAFDICHDAFPQANVWHCRDCLFHLPFADIRRAFENFAHSNIPFALLTTHSARLHRNLDVAVGGFRYLDLERPPISLAPADAYLRDYRPGRDFPRFVGLWTRGAVTDALSRWPV